MGPKPEGLKDFSLGLVCLPVVCSHNMSLHTPVHSLSLTACSCGFGKTYHDL